MEKYLENFQEFPNLRLGFGNILSPGPSEGGGTQNFQLFFADLDELGHELKVTKKKWEWVRPSPPSGKFPTFLRFFLPLP